MGTSAWGRSKAASSVIVSLVGSSTRQISTRMWLMGVLLDQCGCPIVAHLELLPVVTCPETYSRLPIVCIAHSPRRSLMSLQPQVIYCVPEETARVARAIFPDGNLIMHMYDQLGMLFRDADFTDLFPAEGQPAEAPARLALVTLLQFWEGLTDRQAAAHARLRQLVGAGVQGDCFGGTVRPRSPGSGGFPLLLLLRCRKDIHLVRRAVAPQRIDDSQPAIGQRPHGDRVTLAFRPLPLVIRQRPGFLQGGLPGEVLHGVAQRLQTGDAPMGFGIVAALKQHWAGSASIRRVLVRVVTTSAWSWGCWSVCHRVGAIWLARVCPAALSV